MNQGQTTCYEILVANPEVDFTRGSALSCSAKMLQVNISSSSLAGRCSKAGRVYHHCLADEIEVRAKHGIDHSQVRSFVAQEERHSQTTVAICENSSFINIIQSTASIHQTELLRTCTRGTKD